VRSGRRRPRDFAVFYRVNALSRSVESALRDEGVPYQIVNGLEFYQRREIKDMLAYMQLINNPRDDVALLRIINNPPRAIGRSTIGRLSEHAARHRLSLLDAARESGMIESLNKRAAVAVAKFVAMFDRLSLLAAAPLEEILGHVLAETGYEDVLRDSEDPEDQDRLANIQELLTAARQFDERHGGDAPLEAFLEEASLVNDTDAWETENDRVTLMTLHASKGLEFPVVHIVAIEDGLLPHERSRNNDEMLEEERRLLFVGITRAREELHLSLAANRDFRGQRRRTIPSQFLMELPRGEMEVQGAPAGASRFAADDDVPFEIPGEDELPWEGDPPQRYPAAADVSETASSRAFAPLTTAAELAQAVESELPRVSPDVFHQGMVVRHPEYGLGKIVALSGSGERRRASVAFASTAGEKNFVLAKSALRPAKSES
jgi:DNA helicase-2/ATP-dependent DNA helicase PcrA